MKILFISLGCDKNLVDSEVMLGLLASRGYEMIDDEQEADIIVVNTCCFIHDAKQESVDNILEMAEYKKTGKLKALIVTGCLAERYRQEIIDEIPEVDAVLGTTAYDKILDAVDEALEGKHFLEMEDLQALPVVDTKRQTFRIYEDSRRLRQALHILHYSENSRNLSKCTDGAAYQRSRRTGSTRRKRVDSGRTGDDTLWKRPLRRKVTSQAIKRAV